MVRALFFGTPEYGAIVLRALAGEHHVVAAVTQPDCYVGRGRRKCVAPPVKLVAEELGIPVLQPERLRSDQAVLAAMEEAEADLFVLAAYGQILPKRVLQMPEHGVIGVHASLLPRWRGAAPVEAAILHGDKRTGVTLMLTDEGLDTGPIIAQRAVVIEPQETAVTLTTKLAHLGAELLLETLPRWVAGEITPRPQDDDRATLAPPIERCQGEIDWSLPAVIIDRQVRAYAPWPGTCTWLSGTRFKVLAAHPAPYDGDEPPGRVVESDHGLGIVTGSGLLVLDEVQLAGKRAMGIDDFARGQREFVGAMVGEDQR
ncbi:MAG: methionyl-tRNA formyltransferase [Anaerolineae bacterium]